MREAREDAEETKAMTLAKRHSKTFVKYSFVSHTFVDRLKGNRDALLQGDEDLIYDEVDEAQYREIVRRRREEDFIVDDGTGDYAEYADHGGEIWDEEDFEGNSAAAARGNRSHHELTSTHRVSLYSTKKEGRICPKGCEEGKSASQQSLYHRR